MSIKYKIAMLTTLCLIAILLAVNATVYFAFLRITTDYEQELLINRANTLLQKTQATDLIQGADGGLLQNYLPDSGMIRVLDAQGRTLQTIHSENAVLDIQSEAVKAVETDLYREGQTRILTVRVPILSNGDIVGTLEIAEKLDALTENINILISILTLCSLGAIGMSVIGGIYLSRWILHPISGMVHIMEENEQSLGYRRIPLRAGGKDELHALASTFNRMMDRLEENFFRQRQFISDASHELKTPLTIIEGYANMLRRWGLQDEASGKEAVESICSEAARMKQLTQQLLDLAAMENDPELVREPIEMVAFCEEAADRLRKLYRREIRIQSSSNKVFVQADAFKLNQMILILLDNALKYSKDAIDVSLLEKREKGSERPGLEIRVKDRGIGISKEDLSHVFERFYRVDPSRYRMTGGAGLGLSIASHIVRLHGGSIEIESVEHIGTEVIVFIPSP
jgi:two-component system, OmpR family, sensor histidine kinase ArlS